MIKELKLIVADIDGTLVNESRSMMPLTRKVLNDLHQRNVLFGIASGRPIGDHMRERPRHWNLDFYPDFIIGMNGGQLEDSHTGKYEEYYKLQPEVLKEIIELMSPFDVNPFIYLGENQLLYKEDERSRESQARNKVNVYLANDISDFWQKDSSNILFRLGSDSMMPAIEKHIADHPSDKYIGYKTQSWLVEFNDPRVNKGIALKAYCKERNIPLDSVMAFGDTSNDNALLETAGWSVCLKNGTDDTKAVADAITEYDYNEDGVGRYLLDHIYPAMGWEIK